MRFSTSAIAIAGASTAHAAIQGFNYGAGLTTGAAKSQQDFETDFNKAQNLVGTSGWNSARLYTSIQVGTTNAPIAAIPAAIATNTKLLLGIWASAGQDAVTNELAAIQAAIDQYGSKFTDLVVGLSVGSEDLYRITPTGIANKAGIGAGPSVIADYISQVKQKNWGFSIGHVDTWTAWTNSSNNAVIEAVDWLGFDGYPYFESELDNPIGNAEQLFDQSFEATKGVSGGKPVWMTESGWPVSGPQSGRAEASVANAETYWQAVACKLIDSDVNTFWYTLRDAEPTTPSPSFGIIGSDINSDPLYDLTCSVKNSTSSSSSSASSSATSSGMASGTGSGSMASSTGSGTSSLGSADQGQGSPGLGAIASGSASSASSPTGAAGNSTSGTFTAGAPSNTASGNPAQYSTGAASSNTVGSFAAIVAFVGLVARM